MRKNPMVGIGQAIHDKHIVCRAAYYERGETIQFLSSQNQWLDTRDEPLWIPETEYRVKPKIAASKTATFCLGDEVIVRGYPSCTGRVTFIVSASVVRVKLNHGTTGLCFFADYSVENLIKRTPGAGERAFAKIGVDLVKPGADKTILFRPDLKPKRAPYHPATAILIAHVRKSIGGAACLAAWDAARKAIDDEGQL